jgi:hypothetical protein
MYSNRGPASPGKSDGLLLAEFGNPIFELPASAGQQEPGWESFCVDGNVLCMGTAFRVASISDGSGRVLSGDGHDLDEQAWVFTEVPGASIQPGIDEVHAALVCHLSQIVADNHARDGSETNLSSLRATVRKADISEAMLPINDVDGRAISAVLEGFRGISARYDKRVVTFVARDDDSFGLRASLVRRNESPA